MINLDELAAQEKREYQRKWRAANKDKVREINRRYWIKQAEKSLKRERIYQDASDEIGR